MYKLLMLVTLLPSLALANAAEDLVAKLQGLESLRGGFEQTVLDQDGRRAQEASG
ncbi:MAG TPA: outer membrane lipoprotein carrier protein LolA, partial [Alcanivorax sp.]|nr:outer membrane lipoprotein carrier protein LolA [Alcanivorax sp.]